MRFLALIPSNPSDPCVVPVRARLYVLFLCVIVPCRIVSQGIKIVERVEIPPELVPKDAQVEITAKVFGGYHGGDGYKGVSAMMMDDDG